MKSHLEFKNKYCLLHSFLFFIIPFFIGFYTEKQEELFNVVFYLFLIVICNVLVLIARSIISSELCKHSMGSK